MANDTSRRDFLGISALGLVAGVVGSETAAAAERATTSENIPVAPGPAANSEISVWATSGEERFAAAPRATWTQASSGTAAGDQIRLDPALKFQEISGFGGAFTDATCYMFNQLAPAAREKLFHEMFHPSEMGLNFCRVCIGASDYSTKLYSYDDGEADPELKRFSIDHDRDYILPMVRQARQVNPEIFLFATPWSPPGWMKF